MSKTLFFIFVIGLIFALCVLRAYSQVTIVVISGTNIVDYRVLNTNFAALNTGLYALAIGKLSDAPATNGPWSRMSNDWPLAGADSWPAVSGAVTQAAMSWPAVSGAVTAAAGSWPAVSEAVTAAAGSWPAVSGAVTQAANTFPIFTNTLSGPGVVPVGAIMQWPTSNAPAGWLLCDGKYYAHDDYPALYAVIEFTFGGSFIPDRFYLPDLRSRVPVGKSVSGTFGSIGVTGGVETVTLTTAQMPAHNHSPATAQQFFVYDATAKTFWSATWQANSLWSADTYTINTGGGQAHSNMPPFIVLNYIIKY